MAAIPASGMLGQFAEQITPAAKVVFGLTAQPFTTDYGAVPGEVQDTGRGNVSVAFARKEALQRECRRLGLASSTSSVDSSRSVICDTYNKAHYFMPYPHLNTYAIIPTHNGPDLQYRKETMRAWLAVHSLEYYVTQIRLKHLMNK